MFSQSEYQRYARQIILPQFGPLGQKSLKNTKVLIIGMGGLGSPASLYLAAAGVGTLGLADHDTVDVSNLQRQILYKTPDINLPKAEQAKQRLLDLNPETEIIIHSEGFQQDNAEELVNQYDVIMDATDNFTTRYLINDACVLNNKPFIYGSVYQFEGQVSVLAHSDGPCFRCLYPTPPKPHEVPSCAEGGVLGIVPGMIAIAQATEVIKAITGMGRSLVGRLSTYNALDASWFELTIKKNTDCPVCGSRPKIDTVKTVDVSCKVSSANSDAEKLQPMISIDQLDTLIESSQPFKLLDVRTPLEWSLGTLKCAEKIPVAELADRVQELGDTKDELWVITCQRGPRAEKAYNILQNAGFTNLVKLQGGMHAWYMERMTHLESG